MTTPRKQLRRRWALDSQGFRRTGTKESGFQYVTADGRPVREEKHLARIRSLRIPPAWQNVRIARTERSPLQAVGVDSKGRTQYLYSARFRAAREEEKFRRVVEFGESLPRLRGRVRADLMRGDLSREQVLAAIVRLIDQGFFRVGNEKSAKDEETYGLTTIRSDHVRVSGSTVTFDFVGKWRKKPRRMVDDPQVAAVVRRLRRLDGKELFQFYGRDQLVDVKDRHVNDYIQKVIGADFTAKDFRTWAGTLICSVALGMQGQAATKKERKKRVKKAIETTAELLGNTAAVCRSSYICPRLLHEYEEGKPFELSRAPRDVKPVAKSGHSREEKDLLRFLRETIADRRRAPRVA